MKITKNRAEIAARHPDAVDDMYYNVKQQIRES